MRLIHAINPKEFGIGSLFFIFSLAMVFTSPATASSYKKIKAQLEKTYGVKIRFTHLKFPKYWRETYKIRYKPVPKRDRKKALINLKKDLKKYQPHFVRHFLKTIYIFRKLSFDGAPSGGTNSQNLSFLYAEDISLGNKEGVFHHELSSVIWKSYPSNLSKLWSKLNPIDFEYAMEGASGAEAVHQLTMPLVTCRKTSSRSSSSRLSMVRA